MAIRLGLDRRGCRALWELAASVHSAANGFPIPPEAWEDTLEEALAYGEVGFRYFWEHRWEEAQPFLEYSWGTLRDRLAQVDAAAAYPALRAATAWMDWLAYHDRHGDAVRVAHALQPVARAHTGRDAATAYAAGLFYRAAAVAARHQGLRHPKEAVALGRRAHALLVAADREPLSPIAVLRDQAHACLTWGLGWRGSAPEPTRADEALALLDEAERLTGGPVPDLGVRAILSHRYRVVDHLPLLETLERLLPAQGLSLGGWSLDDEQLTLRIVADADHPASLKDPLRVGLHVSNSEIGLGCISLTALITRLVCTNGCAA